MSERLYGLLLRLYPHRFHDEYGSEMRRLFRNRLAAEQGTARLRLWLDILVDLVRSIPREYLRPPAGGVYHYSRWIHLRGLFTLFLLTEVAFVLASLAGPLSRVSNFIEGLVLLLLIGTPFPVINAFKRKPLECTVDTDGIRLDKASIRPVEIARIVEEPRQALVVFGTNGAQIPVWTHIKGYKTLRAQLADWSPIEVLPTRRIPESVLYVGWVTVIVSTNPVLVLTGAAILAAISLYYTLHPIPRAPYRPDSRASRWGNFIAAATVLIIKVFLSSL